MIKIELRLFATLSKYAPENQEAVELPGPTSIKQVVEKLEIPEKEVKLIFVNGKKQEAGYLLQDGDRLGVFPPVGGG